MNSSRNGNDDGVNVPSLVNVPNVQTTEVLSTINKKFIDSKLGKDTLSLIERPKRAVNKPVRYR